MADGMGTCIAGVLRGCEIRDPDSAIQILRSRFRDPGSAMQVLQCRFCNLKFLCRYSFGVSLVGAETGFFFSGCLAASARFRS